MNSTSDNRAYLASCLRHSIQIYSADAPQTSDTLGTLYAIALYIVE